MDKIQYPNRSRLMSMSRNKKNVALLVSLVLFFAFGILNAQFTYLLVIPIFALAWLHQRSEFSIFRRSIVCIAVLLLLFGSMRGFVEGHPIEFISKFSIPLTVFILFCCLPGVGHTIYDHRKVVMIVGFAFTCLVYALIKNRVDLATDYLAGWTITQYSRAGVSSWHYFCLPFISAILVERKQITERIVNLLIAGIWATTLVSLTDTAAFWLAVLTCALLAITTTRVARLIGIVVIPITLALIVDFYSLKFVSRILVELAYNTLAVADEGDLARAIQLDYFVSNAKFLGTGFGASHNFPLASSEYRSIAQLTLPYASELGVLNWMYNGGILAGIWLLALAFGFLRLFFQNTKSGQQLPLRAFGMACCGVIIGSLSNPFIFSPIAMLVLAMMIDISDGALARRINAFSGTTSSLSNVNAEVSLSRKLLF